MADGAAVLAPGRLASGVSDCRQGGAVGGGRLGGQVQRPFWPQAASAAAPARKDNGALTRIWDHVQHGEIVMTDSEFMDRAESVLAAVEASCDRINDETDADIDNQRVGGMVTLTFSNRSQIIVNLQKPLHEIWLAARSGGYHYKFDGQQWLDTKGQGEFFASLSRYASEQAGQPLALPSASLS